MPVAASRRDDLIKSAAELFYHEGFHATGVDRILEVSGVAKMTMYKHFRSKNDLIVAALDRWNELRRNELEESLKQAADDPKSRLLAAIQHIARQTEEEDFNGCVFFHAVAEFPEQDHPAHRAAERHVRAIVELLAREARAAGAEDPESLAFNLVSLLAGFHGVAHCLGDNSMVDAVVRGATATIDLAIAGQAAG